MRLALASMVCALLLVACSGRPGPDLLRPRAVAEPAGARVVRLYSETTRATEPNAPWAYGATRSAAPQYAAFDISIPPEHVAGRIEWPLNAAKADPSRDFVTVRRERMDRAAFLARIGRGDVAVYVHGFNTSFQEALYRLAQLTADAHLEGASVLFSWPSQGRTEAYLADRDAADAARGALAALLSDLAAGRGDDGPVMVMSHSMGARLTMEALRQLRLTGRGDVLDRLEVALAAPDIDVDLFRVEIAAIGQLRHPITVLVSTDDEALEISARLATDRARLGRVDVRDPAVQDLALQSGVRIIDITELPSDDPAHSRYAALVNRRSELESRNSFDGLRRAGAFVFDRVADTFRDIGAAAGG